MKKLMLLGLGLFMAGCVTTTVNVNPGQSAHLKSITVYVVSENADKITATPETNVSMHQLHGTANLPLPLPGLKK